ncbi:MAG TPA: hypothetical protein VGM30_22305 [Puia sp.]|jgi:hypothetical protein
MSAKKKNGLLNPKREPLTPEKLRELSGLNLSDEQAEEIIESLTRFARIIYDSTVQQETTDKCQNELETRSDE